MTQMFTDKVLHIQTNFLTLFFIGCTDPDEVFNIQTNLLTVFLASY